MEEGCYDSKEVDSVEEKEERTITKVPMTRMSRHVNILDSASCSYLGSGSRSKVEYGLLISEILESQDQG